MTSEELSLSIKNLLIFDKDIKSALGIASHILYIIENEGEDSLDEEDVNVLITKFQNLNMYYNRVVAPSVNFAPYEKETQKVLRAIHEDDIEIWNN